MNLRGARIFTTDTGNTKRWVTATDVPYPVLVGDRRKDEAAMGRFYAETEQIAYEVMRETLSPIQRRSPRERHRATLQPLIEDALRSYHATGRIEWPSSVWDVFRQESERLHDPSLLNDTGGHEQVIRQAEVLAAYVTATGYRKQAEQDSKKVTLDWSGH